MYHFLELIENLNHSSTPLESSTNQEDIRNYRYNSQYRFNQQHRNTISSTSSLTPAAIAGIVISAISCTFVLVCCTISLISPRHSQQIERCLNIC